MNTRLRLRQRLMISVTILVAVVLLAAVAVVVGTTHSAINDEMRSSVTLASDIIETSLAAGEDGVNAAHRLDGIGHLRHLCLSLVRGHNAGPGCPSKPTLTAPAWFAALTRPQTLPERRIAVAPDLWIRILANPDDEIDETWEEIRGLLGLFLLFYLTVLAIVYLLMGRAMVPVRRIDAALQRIEYGDYGIRLPRFSLPEFDGIAAQFNHMAASLAAARDENKRLREHSLQIQEDERRNLARELHDELGQSLTAIRADAAGVLAHGETLPTGVAESARAIADVAAHIYDQAHLMMTRLRPPGLDELGLAAALEEHLAGWQRARADITFVFNGNDTPDDLPVNTTIHVFRLIQEALTNALRHAHATRVTVTLRPRGHRLAVHIVDDGDGFEQANNRHGLGLLGMRERVTLLGGRLRIASQPGRGTGIHALIPLNTEAGV